MAPSASAASSPSSSLASHVATVHPSAEQINASGARLFTAKTTARGPGCARNARRGLVLERGLGHPDAAWSGAAPAARRG